MLIIQNKSKSYFWPSIKQSDKAMKNLLATLLVLLSLQTFGQSKKSNPLKAGPMLGYIEMMESVVWLQTTEPTTVFARYYNIKTPKEIFFTDTISTLRKNANTAKLDFKFLEPGTTYEYILTINGQRIFRDPEYKFTTQVNWPYRMDPPSFTMAMASCVYINEISTDRPGKPYGGDYSIFETINIQKPDAMLWLGDNTYLRPTDFGSRSGYLHRASHTRALPEMQGLLSSCPNYAIWDDHDFGPNDGSGSWVNKEIALEAFKMFWPNPSFGFPDLPGTMSFFTFVDADFILMDNRYHRTANFNKGEKHIFGEKQVEYLIDMLKNSSAPFKFVVTGGQFLNSATVYENHINFPKERNYILRRIEEENIQGVIFLSGDRHHSEIMKMDFESGNSIYEFTTSPLTSSASSNVNEKNDYRIKGSLITQRNFSTMTFSGEFGKRQLELNYYNGQGKLLFSYIVNQ